MTLSAQQMRALIERDGGFTVGRTSGLPARRGISLCTRPSQSLSFAWPEWDDERVTTWLGERSGELGWRSPYIGGWLDTRRDRVWLDVVSVVWPAFRPAACLVGRALQQHGVFDLGRGETLILRGDAA